ncbi:hypothetical protein [Mucilaginibacter sp.]
MQLYINDQLADLSDDSPVALTFQINNLAEVKNQQGNTSNQFKLPLTQHNRALLGFPDDIAVTSDLPYTQYPVKVVQDGLEIIPYGTGELSSIEQDVANFTILSGNVDFFDNIDGKLYEMGDQLTQWGKAQPWLPYQHQWTLQNVVASQTYTDGWIWPIVDYGKIPPDDTGTPEIDVRYLRPGFFLHTAIDLLVQSAGYRAKGSLLNDPLYKKLIVQFANDSFTHGTDYQNGSDNLSVVVSQSQNQQLNDRTIKVFPTNRILFTTEETGIGLFNLGTRSYTAPENMKATITFAYNVAVRSNHKNKGATIRFFIRANSPDNQVTDYSVSEEYGATGEWGTYSTYADKKISVEVDMPKNTQVLVTYALLNTYTEATLSKATLSIINRKEEVLYSQMVQCERIFPDISQKDLLKDTLQHFGIICQTDNTARTVTFASFRDIVNNIPVAKNWTEKCLNQGKAISFQLGGYAQINVMKYKEDEHVLPAGFANAQITVKDATLAATADLFESQFAPSLNRRWIGDTIAQIVKTDTTSDKDDFSVNTQPRLLIDQKLDLRNYDSRTVRFTDGGTSAPATVNGVLSVPYFDKPAGEYSLLYDQLRLKYYPELEKILKRSKKVVRYFLLSPRDILELDLLIPIYLEQDSAYYYINKIDSWRKGQPTKAELILLG